MKKSLLLSAFTAVLSFGALAQNYYYYKTVGIPAGYSSTPPTGATAVLTGSATATASTLSTAQSFPFANWTLYGFNVTQFKVSTSGYITFDPNQTADNTSNTALPDVAAPKLSIFAFWDNTCMQTVTQGSNTFASGVKSWTYGTAPNRTFVVQWQLIQVNGTSSSTQPTNVTYYAVLFNEAGGFDVLHNYGFGTFGATVGVQNIDGTIGKHVTGSPNLNFGGANGGNDPKASVLYHFKFGVQPTFDLKVKASLTPEVTSKGVATTIKVVADNYGAQDMTGAKMNFSINGGITVPGNVTAAIGNSGGSAQVSHPTTYSPQAAAAGTTQAIKVWFTEINGGSSLSDTLTFDLFVNNGTSGSKKVLIEEGSGAWCGYCVDGHTRLKEILANNPTSVFAGVHHNSDAMVNTASTEFNNTYATGYPYGTVDRKKYDDQDEVGMNRGEWATKAAEQLNASTPVNVSIINKNFDWAAGTVTYTVKVDFVDFAKPGDLRIGTMVIEDKVRGSKISATSTQWNQRNYYTFEYGGSAAGGPDHPLYTEPEFIIGYWHNEVVRALPSGTWGTAGVITNPAPGQSFTYTYTHTMTKATAVSYPEEAGQDNTDFRSTKSGRGWNKFEDTRLIAFVSYYNADVNKREILNVAQTNMLTNTAVNETKENPIGSVAVYPNPVADNATVNFNMNTASNVQVDVINVVGQKVTTLANRNYAAGEHSVFFTTENLENGIYFVTVSSAEGKSTYRFVVSK
jgi:hypothetical protein